MQIVDYSYKKSLRELQRENETEFLKRFSDGNYTFDAPMVAINPYLVNPLAALVLFENSSESPVSLTVCGADDESTFHHTFLGEKRQIIPVLGLYAERETTVILECAGKVNTLKFTATLTDEEKANFPQVVSFSKNSDYQPGGLMFCSSALREYPCAIDSKGDVRWLINVAMQWQMKPLKNGRWLCGTERQLVQPYYVTGLYEMDLTGRIYKEYYVPGGYHHAFIEMEDGNLLVATDDLAHGWLEDTVVLLDRKTGEILKTWDLKNIMTPGDGKGSKYLPDDWFHNNALQYDKQTNAIILSGRHVDSIISIDYDSGKLNWILGDPDGWSEDKQKYFFKPIGDDFEWPYAPHSCVMTDSNNVYCFDNGCARSKNPAKYRKNGDNYSRGVHYQIDTEKMEIRQVWQYGKERGSDFFSMYISNVFPYTDNHVLVHSGGIGYFEGKPWEKEYVPVLIKNPETEPYAITVELVDDKVVYELKQRGNYYRALRMPMYKEGYHLEMSVSEVLGCLDATLEESMPIAETMNALPPEEVCTEVIEEEDRMTIRCFLKLGTEASLLLEQGEERHYYKIETNLRPLVRLIQSGGEVAEGYSVMILAITKTGLRGDYSVKLLADGKVYDTNVKIKGGAAQ